MKRVGLWAMGIGLFITVGLITVEQGHPAGHEECSNASYRGDYGFTATGTTPGGAIAIVGRFTADGHGHISGTQTRIVANSINSDTYTETYTVNPDCTGSSTKTLTSGGNPIDFDFVIVQGGRKIRSIEKIPNVNVEVTLVADRISEEDD